MKLIFMIKLVKVIVLIKVRDKPDIDQSDFNKIILLNKRSIKMIMKIQN